MRTLQKLRESQLQTITVDVCQMLADLHSEYGSLPDKPITLSLHGNDHCHVRANELLYDVFSNLVTNAIKHTRYPAQIRVDLDIINQAGVRYCRVSVEDDGPGIPDDFKPKVFKRLLPGTAKARGMGLGLYLVKSLIDDFGGEIWVEDRVPGDPSRGARFVVLLPMADVSGTVCPST